MGLDAVFYNREDQVVNEMEISADLHDGIFNKTNNWGSYLLLRKLKDYYKTDLTLTKGEMDQLRDELKQVSIFLNSRYKSELFKLIVALGDTDVSKVHIAGD